MKKELIIVALLLVSVFAVAAHAIPATIGEVRVDDTVVQPVDVTDTNSLSIDRGQTFEVRVTATATDDIPNAEVQAYISGYEYDNYADSHLSDTSGVFDMSANTSYVKKLSLTLPTDVQQDNYKLRVVISDRNGQEVEQDYNLKIDAVRHSIVIQDAILNPSQEVRSGSALLATVRLENDGQDTENDVKVTASLPGLGISASDYIDEIKSGKQKDTQEMYLRIPKCAKEGSYDLTVDVSYSNGHETEHKTYPMTVTADDTCTPTTVAAPTGPTTTITLGSTLETATQGGNVIFPITLTNSGIGARSYTVAITGNDWADVKLSPASTVVVDPGKSETINAFVTVNADATVGPHTMTATVTSGTDKLQDMTLTVNTTVAPTSGWDTLKRVLIVTLIVLVALLVILGLIIGISRMKGSEEDSGKTQTYY